jgi:hypothetical protein
VNKDNEVLIREALEKVCERDGLLDLALLDAPFFAEAMNLATVVDGEPVVDDALAKMKEMKPELFFQSDWATLNDEEFTRKSRRLIDALQGPEAVKAIPKVDAAKLSPGEFAALSNLLRSNGRGQIYRSVIEEVSRRQQEASNV